MREAVVKLAELGTFPSSALVNLDVLAIQQDYLAKITRPVSDEEAEQLVSLFGPDDYFGLAWVLLHLVESAPGWPLYQHLTQDENEWIVRLKRRASKIKGR